jgi:hypothetical protein
LLNAWRGEIRTDRSLWSARCPLRAAGCRAAPPVFYLGHLEVFDGTRSRSLPGLLRARNSTTCSRIDPVGGGLPDDVPTDWPAEAAIRRYNQRVRAALDAALARASASASPPAEEPPELLLDVAIEHRLMHAETLRTAPPAGAGGPAPRTPRVIAGDVGSRFHQRRRHRRHATAVSLGQRV